MRNNYSWQFCSQVLIKLLWAYSFQEMFFIGRKLGQIHVTFFSWTFDLFLINTSKQFLFQVWFLIISKKNTVCKHTLQRKQVMILKQNKMSQMLILQSPPFTVELEIPYICCCAFKIVIVTWLVMIVLIGIWVSFLISHRATRNGGNMRGIVFDFL